MKARRIGPAVLVAIWLVVFMWLQHSTEAAEAAEPPTVATQVSVSVSVATPDDTAPLPMASCFLTCARTCIAEQCGGLDGALLQQCSRDCAEGCSCSCGLACP